RKDHQPSLIELLTYRFRGHSMSDPQKYRTKDEVEEWRIIDPMFTAESELRDVHGWTDEQFEEFDDAVVEEMQAAADFADASPLPDPEFRFRNHYVED